MKTFLEMYESQGRLDLCPEVGDKKESMMKYAP